MKPHPDTIAIVHAWLESHGIDAKSEVLSNSAGDWISLRLPLAKVESMLDSKYLTYRHKRTDEKIIRTLSYSLPRELHEHIDIVQPTTMFDNMRKMHATFHENNVDADVATNSEAGFVSGPAGQNISASCNTTITPTCLMQLYRTEGYVPQAADKGNRIGVTGYLEQVRILKRRTTTWILIRQNSL